MFLKEGLKKMELEILNGDNLLRSLSRVTANRMKGAHDSQMVIIGGKAYIVYECNDIRPGENSDWEECYAAMSMADAKSGKTLAVHTIAYSGQKFENVSLLRGCCFVPRIIQLNDNTLRTFFISLNNKDRQSSTWYRDYDIPSATFSNKIHQVFMETSFGVFPMSSAVFYAQAVREGFQKPEKLCGPYLMDVAKGYPDKRHLVVTNFEGKQNALCVWNDTFDTVCVLGNINEPQSEALCEAVAEILPDSRGWGAIIRNDKAPNNYMFTSSKDGIHWETAHFEPGFPDSSNSKAFFYRFTDIYFLGWQQKPYRTRFNIMISRDCRHWKQLVCIDNREFSLQYISLAMENGIVYLCATHGFTGEGAAGKDSIWFGKLVVLSELEEIWDSLPDIETDPWRCERD